MIFARVAITSHKPTSQDFGSRAITNLHSMSGMKHSSAILAQSFQLDNGPKVAIGQEHLVRREFALFGRVILASAVVCLAFVTGCKSGPDPAATADTIYYGGDIVTVNDAKPNAEALAVKDGKILMVGSSAEVESAHKGQGTVMVDLAAKTMTPGFVDPHSHFLDSMAVSQRVNVSPPPAGPAKNPEEIIAEIKKLAVAKETGELLIAYGYDENQMPKGHQLTRNQLDKAFPDYPVVVLHVSGHGAVLNSLAFTMYGYKDGMPTPAGGVINRKPGTQTLEGLVMETAFLTVYAKLPKVAPDQEIAQAKAGQMIYAAAGVTTAQEGLTQSSGVLMLKRLAEQKALFIDIESYPFALELDKILATTPPSQFGTFNNHLKFAGCKLPLDGSPQGKTAFFTTHISLVDPAARKTGRVNRVLLKMRPMRSSRSAMTITCR